MPIKFRCPHCRQFLGISPSQAGMIVDCPMCGRAVRVPHADGRVEPLPPPELDLRDARLQQALDDLALIGAGPLRKSASGQMDAPEDDRVAAAPPVESPEPVPAPEPVPVPTGRPAEEEQSLAEALAQLANLAPAKPPVHVTLEEEPSSPWRWVALVSLTAAMAFLAGFFAGRGARPPVDRINVEPEKTAATVADDGPAERHSGTPSIRGRITWRTTEGESRPDRGARVYVLPEMYAGESRVSISALQADAGSDSFNTALDALRALGGDLAIVDDEGAFEARVPTAGVYTILAVSNYQPRAAGAEIEPGTQSVLERFFDRPSRVLGSTQYRAAQLRFSGEGGVLWDHSFERS